MRQRSYVDNLGYLDTGTMNSSHSRFTAVSGSFYIGFHFPQTQVISHFCTILCGHLSGIRSIFLGASEAHLTCRRPRDHLTLAVGKRYNNVVERRMDMGLSYGINLYNPLLCCDCFLCHTYLLFSSFFLICNGFLFTFTRTGVVLGALASHRQTDTVTDTPVATDIHKALDVQLYFGTKVTLHLILGTDDFTYFCRLVVGPIFHFDVFVNAGFTQNGISRATTDTIDIGQGDLTPFILRQVYTNNSYCHILESFNLQN